MARFGFTSYATYQSQSPNADCERAMNIYPESVESGQGNAAIVLYEVPGTKVFTSLSGPSIRGQINFIMAEPLRLSGGNFYEIFADGTKYSSRHNCF